MAHIDDEESRLVAPGCLIAPSRPEMIEPPMNFFAKSIQISLFCGTLLMCGSCLVCPAFLI